MDWIFISSVFTFATIILVITGLVLLLFLTYKYEKLAAENPDDAASLRERRKTILKIYLRVVIIVFLAAIITLALSKNFI
jgi:uncharacterized membrane protein